MLCAGSSADSRRGFLCLNAKQGAASGTGAVRLASPMQAAHACGINDDTTPTRWLDMGGDAAAHRGASAARRTAQIRVISLPAVALICSMALLATCASTATPRASAGCVGSGAPGLKHLAMPRSGRESRSCRLHWQGRSTHILRLSGGWGGDEDDSGDEPARGNPALSTVEQTLAMLEEGQSDWSSMDKDKVSPHPASAHRQPARPRRARGARAAPGRAAAAPLSAPLSARVRAGI